MVIRIGGGQNERDGDEAAREAIGAVETPQGAVETTQQPQDPPPSPFGDRRVDLRGRLGLAASAPPEIGAADPAPTPDGGLLELLEADQARRNEQGRDLALASFSLAVKSDPAVRAEAQEIAQQLGVDPDTAERNLGVMREYAKVRALRERVLAGANPVLARHVSDIEFARIAHDDVESLGAWERLFAQWDVGRLEAERGYLGTKLRAGQATRAETERLAWVGARLAAMPQASGLFEGAVKILGQQAETLPRAVFTGELYAAAAGGTALVAGQLGPQVALPEEVVTVPTAMAGGFAVGFVGELANQSFKIEGGNAYLDMVEQGYDREVAGRTSIGVGVANAALELVGVKLLARGAGITTDALRAALRTEVREGVQAALTKPTLGEAAKNFLKAYGTGLAGEVSTEVAQEAVNIAAEEITRQLSENPEALSSSVTRGEIVQRLVDVAAQTAQGMALLAAPGPGVQLVRDARRASAAEHTAQFWRELGTAADASQVRTRNVGRAERFLADAAAGTQASNTYVDGQAFAEVLRQADLEALDRGDATLSEKLERALPGITEQVAAAAARGDDVVLSTAEVGSKIAGTEAYAPLVQHLRLDPDAMSAAEAQRFRQEANERAAEAAEILQQSETENQAFAASARGIEENLRQQLVDTGRMQFQDAQAAAKFYRDIIVLKAQQADMLPADFVAKFPLRILSEEDVQGLEALQQLEAGGERPDGLDGAGSVEETGTSDADQPADQGPAEVPGDGGTPGDQPARGPARWNPRSDVSGHYAARTELVESHTRELGAESVTTPEEAGQAFAFLGRGAVEHFDALVTDKDGRPLAIVGAFKGAVAETSVHVATLVSEAFRIEGAANIWFAHNHPSGTRELSSADRMMHARLVQAFEGSEITPRGLFAIAGRAAEDREWVFEPSSAPGQDVIGRATKPARTTTVSVVERELGKDGRLGPSLAGPADAWQFANSVGAGEAGVILLDARNQPLGFLPVDRESATTLRREGRMDAVYRAVSVANPAGVVLVDNGRLGRDAATNLGRLFATLGLQTLDVVDTSKGPTDSWSNLGIDLAGEFTSKPFRSGSRGSYDPRTFTILLHKKADASTFLHELAHHYLHVLGELAAAPDAPEAFTKDMDELLRWFGVRDIATWQSMTLEQQRKHHEAFAYSFETWLFEGRAPSRELEGLFRRFARWLRRVYTTIRDELNRIYRKQFGEDLPVLTPEVRGVMERMVASEEQIAHQEQVDSMAGVFESQEAAGVGDAEWAAYLEMRDESREAAIEQHTRDSLRQMRWLSNARGRILRELQKREDAARERVRGEVDAELRREPVYRAQRWLTHGELDGAPAIPVGVSHKLATAAVRALLPEGTDLRRFGGRYGLVAKDGLLPDVVAGMFGFETGRELVEALVAARPLDKVVAERTDERMLEEHSDLVDPAQRQAAVDEALHNEARTRQIGVEMRMLTRAMQPVRLLTAAARQAAKRIIGRQKVGEVDPRRHSLAEARAARRVADALRRGDTEAAIAAQRQRLLQHELYKEAARADDERGETITTFQRFFDADEKIAQTRDIDLVYPGRALAAAFGFGRKLLDGQESQLVRDAMVRLAETHPVLATNVSAWLSLQSTRGTAYVDLTMEELRDLREQAESLWSEAAQSRFVELEGRRAELAEVVGGFTLRIDDLPRRAAPGARAGEGGTPSGLGRVAMRFWNAVAHMKRVAHWARFMDGSSQGPFHTYLLDPIDAALARYRDARDRMVKRVRDRVVEVAKAAGTAWDAKIAAPELGFTFSGKKELLGALLHAGSLSNLTKLLVGYGWAPPPHLTNDYLVTENWDRFVARMFDKGILTQQDVEFVKFVWDTYKEQLPENQAAHKRIYGFEFATIEHRELQTPFGTLEGGYVPAYTDRDLAQPRLDGRRLDALEGEEFAFIYSVSTGRGHTLQRNPFYLQPLSLDVSRQVAHMDQQLRFTHLQPQIKQSMRIIRNRDFKASLDAYDREAVQTILVPWLESVAAHSSTRPSTNPFLDMVATAVRRSVSLVYLGFNIGNSLIQLSGFNNARAEVSGRWMRAGLWTLVRNPMAAVRDAMDRSSLMRDRFDTSAEAYREEIQRLGNMPFDVAVGLQRATRKQRQRLGRAAFFAQRIVQGMVDTMTWHGAYQQSLAESRADGSVTLEQAEAAAVRDADLAVRRTQGSGNPEDAAAYEQNTPLMKLMLQFSQYPNLVLNQIMGAGHGVRPRLQAMLWTLLLPAIAESTMKMLLVGVPDDGDGDGLEDELAEHYARGLARNVVGLVPVAGPMALAMAETEGTRVMASPASSILQSFFRAGFAGADAAGGGELSSSEVREIGKMLTVLTGFPIVPLTRAAAYDMDVDSGRAERPTNTVDYLRGLVVGR